MFEFKHPNYYKELRKRNKTGVTAATKRDIGHSQELSFGFPPPVNSDQAISKEPATAGNQRSPDPGLKPQASSSKPQASTKLVNACIDQREPQAPSSKLQKNI